MRIRDHFARYDGHNPHFLTAQRVPTVVVRMTEPLKAVGAAVDAQQRPAGGAFVDAEPLRSASIPAKTPLEPLSDRRLPRPPRGQHAGAFSAGSKSFPRTFATGMVLALAQSFILLAPAVLNGFPFVFSDTGTYLESALTLTIPYDRPVYYSVFAAVLHWRMSPWPIVIAQSLIVVRLLNLALSTIFGLESWALRFCLTAVLATASGLSFFVGQLTPDVFTGAMILAIALCTLSWTRLTFVDRMFALCVIVASITFHSANVLIALAIVPALALIAVFGWPPCWRGVLHVGGAGVIGVTALVASNVIAGRNVTLSPGSSVFLFAKLLEDGPGLETLDDLCTRRSADFAVCREREALEQYASAASPSGSTRESISDYFLWNGPLASLGWFSGFRSEAAILSSDALHRLRWKHVALAGRQAIEQMIWFNIGDGLGAYQDTERPSVAIRWIFGEAVFDRYKQSLQQKGELSFSGLNLLQHVSVAISALVIAIAFVFPAGATQNAKSLAVLVLTFLAVNAAVTGILSTVHDRYQSRVIWLLVFVATAIVLSTVSKRTSETS
jgi:hypothetical protein